jgi:hypothetical protein
VVAVAVWHQVASATAVVVVVVVRFPAQKQFPQTPLLSRLVLVEMDQ